MPKTGVTLQEEKFPKHPDFDYNQWEFQIQGFGLMILKAWGKVNIYLQ